MRPFIAISIVMFALLGCGGGKQVREITNVCDTSLQRCVSTLGEQHKDKCYETYHDCMTGCKK